METKIIEDITSQLLRSLPVRKKPKEALPNVKRKTENRTQD